MDPSDYQIIRQLFDDYLRMYSSRDDRLTTHFSEDFSGFTGGGDFLVKNKDEWVAITRQDFGQIKLVGVFVNHFPAPPAHSCPLPCKSPPDNYLTV